MRFRILLALLLLIVGSGAGVYFVSSRTMIEGFRTLEADRAREDVMRVHRALNERVVDLHSKSIDWSNWDDTYQFMKDRNAEYVKSNMLEQSFVDLKVDLVMLLDTKQQIFYQVATQRGPSHGAVHAEAVLAELKKNGYLSSISPTGDGASGIVLQSSMPIAVTIRPIRNTEVTQPSRGWFIFARALGHQAVDQLRAVTRQDVSLVTPSAMRFDKTLPVGELGAHQPIGVRALDDSTLIGCSLVRDIHKRPALVLKTRFHRRVYQQGLAAAKQMTEELLLISILFSTVLIFVVERFAVSRIHGLSRQVEDIKDFSSGSRLHMPGGDELTSLADKMNEMLTTLEHTVQERAKEAEHYAFHDKLTGLPNRSLFMDRLDLGLKKARRSEAGLAVLFVDLDNFKLVNDSLGHQVGDELLVTVAKRLSASVRPGDTVARLGGDEFTILLEDLGSEQEAVDVAQRILESLHKSVTLGSHVTYAFASIGIAFCEDFETTGALLLKNADIAMYQAKAAGRGSYALFEERMRDNAIERLELETALRTALRDNEISVAYQPFIDLESNRIIGAEALARWNSREKGVIPPEQFIPIAEDTGLIIPIGYWIMEQACQRACEWIKRYDYPGFVISVNLSGRQLQQDDVVERVRGILERTGLPPSSLKIEITESVLLEDRSDLIDKMNGLKELGILLALDDFGTGYSSLSMLRIFPIDTLKIDRSFVGRLGEDDGAIAIVQAILSLAHSMQMDVISEGVETPFQEQAVRGLGCRTGQGFLYDVPLTTEEFDGRLSMSVSRSSSRRAA